MTFDTDDILTLRDLVLGGASEDEVCITLKKTPADVRAIVAVLGLSFHPLARREWCVRGAHPVSEPFFDKKTGWCKACTEQARNTVKAMAIHDEELALRAKEVHRKAKALDKARERMREEFGTNPRKGAAWDDEDEDYIDDGLEDSDFDGVEDELGDICTDQ